MKVWLTITVTAALVTFGCKKPESSAPAPSASPSASPTAAKQVDNTPPLAPNNIVNIAAGSKDHTTLVTAIKAADYVTSVAASGPLTVFAPTNAAFDKLPEGTVEGLLKPESVDTLREILKYHVTTSALKLEYFKDGQTLGMANGAKTTLSVKDGKVTINGANVVASIPGSNGIVHVIDGVLLPPEKK